MFHLSAAGGLFHRGPRRASSRNRYQQPYCAPSITAMAALDAQILHRKIVEALACVAQGLLVFLRAAPAETSRLNEIIRALAYAAAMLSSVFGRIGETSRATPTLIAAG